MQLPGVPKKEWTYPSFAFGTPPRIVVCRVVATSTSNDVFLMPSLRSSSRRGESNPKTRCLTPILVFVIFILAAFYLLVALVGTHHVHHHDLPTASAAGRTEETDTLTRRVVALVKRVSATENELYMTKAAISVKSGSASGMHGIFSNVADSPHAFKTTPHNTKTTPIVNVHLINVHLILMFI